MSPRQPVAVRPLALLTLAVAAAHLLFLSRMNEEKGAHLAIEVAQKLRMPLVMAGNINAPDLPYFREQVEPHIDGDLIRYVGEADQRMKRCLFSEAKCLLAPVTLQSYKSRGSKCALE